MVGRSGGSGEGKGAGGCVVGVFGVWCLGFCEGLEMAEEMGEVREELEGGVVEGGGRST